MYYVHRCAGMSEFKGGLKCKWKLNSIILQKWITALFTCRCF